jgi:hypothetical protein
MKSIFRLLSLRIFFAVSSILFFTYGCAKKEFDRLVPGLSLNISNSHADFCEPTITDVKATTFYIFIADSSASQNDNDRDGYLRFTPIFDFILKNQGLPDDRYSLMLFADDASLKIPLKNHDDFTADITTFWEQHQWEDIGFSNMASALNMVRTTLEQYALEHRFDEIKPYASVQIILLSDGYPKIARDSKIPKTDLINIIKGQGADGGLLGLANQSHLAPFFKSIKVHTAYYWGNYLGGSGPSDIPEDPENRALMKEMAEAGNGKFLEFKDGQMVDLSQFQQIEARLRKQLVSYYIIPEGVLWNEDKKNVVADFDHDGIADHIEVEIGSDFTKKDTDEDGVSDGVQLRTTQYPCRDSSCEVASRLDPLCHSYLKPDYTIRDSDGDGLNDCEEFYLQSNKESVDTNRNFVADFDEFLLGLNLSQENLLVGDTDGDKLSDLTELRKYLPLFIPNQNITSDKDLGMEYELIKTRQLNDGRFCYSLDVKKVPMSSSKNTFHLILAFQNPFITKSVYFYQARGNIGKLKAITQDDVKQMIPDF